jgi:hypothetical protein
MDRFRLSQIKSSRKIGYLYIHRPSAVLTDLSPQQLSIVRGSRRTCVGWTVPFRRHLLTSHNRIRFRERKVTKQTFTVFSNATRHVGRWDVTSQRAETTIQITEEKEKKRKGLNALYLGPETPEQTTYQCQQCHQQCKCFTKASNESIIFQAWFWATRYSWILKTGLLDEFKTFG